MTKIAVIGAGAWGTALAITVARADNEVMLWAREAEVVDSVNINHQNAFLPNAVLPEKIVATSDLSKAIAFAEDVLLVAPAQFTRSMLEQIKPFWQSDKALVLCAKGLELNTGLLLTEVVEQTLPEAKLAVLSGPGFAAEVAKGNPTATTIASKDEQLAESLVNMLGSPRFRPYYSTDIVAPEVCGALKNVIAIASGVVDGCGYGDNARAALITRGLHEMARFASALGGGSDTVFSMAGVGDLVLTCCSTQSRNYSFGFKLGQTRSAEKVLAESTATVEGVATAAAVMKRAREFDIDMPICAAVEAAIYKGVSVDSLIDGMLTRPYKSESKS